MKLLMCGVLPIVLLSLANVQAGDTQKEPKAAKGNKSPKPSNIAPPEEEFGEVELFHQKYDFFKNDSPESVVFDSKGNAYVSLTLTAFISVLDPHGEEITRIELPQGDCRPDGPSDISFPLSSLQFGMAMSKDDTLYVSLLACAEGFPQPPNPNPNTGLWVVNTHDYSIKQVARVPNADGRSRQEFCCEWNTNFWQDADPPYLGKNPDGTCNVDECCFYEAVTGSRQFPNIDEFCGYAEIWNGVEVIGDCVYVTNSYFHEIWRICPPKDDSKKSKGAKQAKGSGKPNMDDNKNGDEEFWVPELWMEYGHMNSPDLTRLKGTFFTAAGFNGIKYFRGDIYVANTAQGKIIKIPMVLDNDHPGNKYMIEEVLQNTGGRGLTPGNPKLVFEGGDVDEFVISHNGNIYAALFEDNEVIKISPDGKSEIVHDGNTTYGDNCPQFGTGSYRPEYDPTPEVDLPTSVAFGTNGETNEKTLYIANSGFVFFKSCAGNPILKPDGDFTYYDAYPGITRVYVGEKGEKQQW